MSSAVQRHQFFSYFSWGEIKHVFSLMDRDSATATCRKTGEVESMPGRLQQCMEGADSPVAYPLLIGDIFQDLPTTTIESSRWPKRYGMIPETPTEHRASSMPACSLVHGRDCIVPCYSRSHHFDDRSSECHTRRVKIGEIDLVRLSVMA